MTDGRKKICLQGVKRNPAKSVQTGRRVYELA